MHLNSAADDPVLSFRIYARPAAKRVAGLLFAGLLVLLSGFLLGLPLAWGQTADDPPAETEIGRKQLLNAAYNSLWRLQRAIERDGFSSARVALNVWRSNAMDAGIFKPSQYEDFKRQIYEKSIRSSLACIETAIVYENFSDARRCLHTWKIHSEEINRFERQRYEELQRLIEEKSKAAAEKKEDE
jgi:hypothetical protein